MATTLRKLIIKNEEALCVDKLLGTDENGSMF